MFTILDPLHDDPPWTVASWDIPVHVELTQFIMHWFRHTVFISVCACVWTHSWLVFSVTGWLMGLICPTVLCVRQSRRPHWRTWVKERIIDSDKALPALIAAGELDYLFKVPSLAEGEPYQWSPDWPHIVLLWTCSGRAQGCVCMFGIVRVFVLFGLKLLTNFYMFSCSVYMCVRRARPVSIMSRYQSDI